MKTGHRVLGLVVVLALFGACQRKEPDSAAAKAVNGKIRLLGAGAVAILVAPLADAFHKQQPDVKIEVEPSNSNWGIGAVRNGMTDIAMSTRKPYSEDADLVVHTLARDGLCMIVNKDNPVTALSDQQIAGIFKGEIASWKDVGGNDAPIERVQHAEVRQTLVMFVKHLGLQVSDMRYAELVIGSDRDGVAAIAVTPNAITYTSIAVALQAVDKGEKIKLIGLRGVAPTVENVENGTVPIVYDIDLVTKGVPAEPIKSFVDFASSAAAAPIVKERRFAPKKS